MTCSRSQEWVRIAGADEVDDSSPNRVDSRFAAIVLDLTDYSKDYTVGDFVHLVDCMDDD